MGSTVSRRQFLKVAGVTAAGALLGSCRPWFEGLPTESPVIQLVYQDWRTDWFPPMVQGMLDRFHAEQPDIRVFYVPDPEDVEESLIEDLRAGTGADVFSACCSFFPILAQENLTLDLHQRVEADLPAETVADWDPAQYRSLFTLDGRQYGLPKYHGALALYYNKDLFDIYRIDYPDGSWTLDDYTEAMRQLTRDRDRDGKTDLWGSMLDISWDRIQVHINAWGGHLVDPNDPRRSRFSEPPALAAMEWIRSRMWDDKVMATPLDVQNLTITQAFIDERVAMVEDGSWSLKNILSQAKFRIGIAPLPAGPVRRVTLATTDGWGIYRRTRYPDEAWELLKFLVSKEYGLAMAKANFLQPARASLVEEWIRLIQLEFPEQTREVDIGAFAEGHIQGYSVTSEVFANMSEAKRLIYDAWDKIYILGEEPVDIMKEVSRQVDAAQAYAPEAGQEGDCACVS